MQDKKDIFYGRISSDRKISEMKAVYRLFVENYSVTNYEIMDALRSAGNWRNTKNQIRTVIDTLSDVLPIWVEEDVGMKWYGMLDTYQPIPELEDG